MGESNARKGRKERRDVDFTKAWSKRRDPVAFGDFTPDGTRVRVAIRPYTNGRPDGYVRISQVDADGEEVRFHGSLYVSDLRRMLRTVDRRAALGRAGGG